MTTEFPLTFKERKLNLDDLIFQADQELQKNPLKRKTLIVKTEKYLCENGYFHKNNLYLKYNKNGLIEEVFVERKDGTYVLAAKRF